MNNLDLFSDDIFNKKNDISNNINFDNIKAIFDKLNEDKNHFVNSNDICTPMDCVKEMLDTIPQELWERKNLKILDSCCGNGNFHAYAQLKTKLSNLYFNEINKKRIVNLKNYFGDNINLTIKDFLEFPNDEIYDLVVSNPPYAKFTNEGERASKNHNLSRDFIKKALTITKQGGYILFIVPNNWMSFSDRNSLPKELSNYQFLHLNIHGAKKWFPKVGSSFTWFLLHKVPNKKSFIIENNYIIKDKQTAVLPKNSNFIPLYYSNIVASILAKTINNTALEKYKIETSSYLHRFTKQNIIKNEQNDEYKYKLIHTPTQTVYSSKPHKFQDGYKVFLSLTNQYEAFIDNCGMTQSVAFIKCKSLKEAERIKKELENPLYKFLNNITRYGNFNNIRVLQNFPIFTIFNLTKEEESFIEIFNEKY